MTLARGYDAMKEDPNIYKTLDFCGYSASKHFPDIQLPVPGAPSVSDSAQSLLLPLHNANLLLSTLSQLYKECTMSMCAF